MNFEQTVLQIQSDLRDLIDPERAVHATRYFKALPGQYGEGDRFLGISVPNTRSVIKKHRKSLSLPIAKRFLESVFHEERLFGVLAMVALYQQTKNLSTKKEIVLAYLKAVRDNQVNNWDLVDSSAHHILGHYLQDRPRDILVALALSDHLWSQRTAVISCMAFVKREEKEPIFTLCNLLLVHPHDLIHKACGWMLRELGQKNEALLKDYLNQHAAEMPRTMLRYAIEKLPPSDRQKYMKAA